MSVRLPLKIALDYNDSGNTGATSVVSQTFYIPQDTDGVVLKIPTASVNGTAPTADVYFQTSDDGGTTFYDVARVGIPATVTSSVLVVTNTKPMWVPMSTYAYGNASVISNASVRGLAVNTVSGIPIMGLLNRVQIAYGGTVAANNGLRVQVLVNQQSNRA